MAKAKIAIYKDVLRTGRGADRATAALANALVTFGYEVHILTRQGMNEPLSVTFAPEIVCHWVRGGEAKGIVRGLNKFFLKTRLGAKVLQRLLPWLDCTRRLSLGLHACLQRIQPAVVISEGTNECVELTYAGALPYPLIQMFHVYPPTCFKKNKYQRVTRLKAALRQVTEHVVLLPSFRATLKPYTSAPITAIGNCVTYPVDAPLPPPASRAKVIVYIAYFTKDKDQLSLIDAFARLQHAEDWELHLYGSGTPEWEKRLQNRIAELKLGARVRIIGITKTPRTVLERASICAFPSRVEGFSLALLEAMWCGLPCVGYRSAPSVNELIVHEANGLLAEGDDGEAFAKPLQRLIDDPELRERLSCYAARTVRATYTPEKIWQQWDDLLSRHLQH